MFGEEFRRLRAQKGLTLEQLERELGLSQSTISRWQRDSQPPKREVVEQLDKLLQAGGQLMRAAGYMPAEWREESTITITMDQLKALQRSAFETGIEVGREIVAAEEGRQRLDPTAA